MALLEAARCRIVTVRGVDVTRDHPLAACALPGVAALLDAGAFVDL